MKTPKQLTIVINTALSNSIKLSPPPAERNTRKVALRINDADSWVSANVGIQGSFDNTNFYNIESGGTIVGAAPTATAWDTFDVPVFPYYRLHSYNPSGGAAVNQTAAMTFDVVID